jgi:hypothetical protein
MTTHAPAHPTPVMKTKAPLPTIILSAVVGAAIVAVVWFALETGSQVIGVWQTALLSLIPLAASLWGLFRILRR